MASLPGAVAPEHPLAPATWELPEQVSLWQDSWRRLRRSKLAVAGLVVIGILFAVAIVSQIWTPYPVWRQAIGPTYQGPTLTYPLGLDASGRDILSRIMGGAAIAIEVGVATSLLVSAVGITVGLLAGFYRGTIDTVVTFLINVWYGIPDLLVALIIVVVTQQRGLYIIIFAIVVTRWMDMARLVRGQTFSLREREFVEAARSTGVRDFWIIFRHIFPNALGPILIQATFLVPQAILFEAFLSFLGLGVRPPAPSWGAMAVDGYHALQIAPHIALAPAVALSVTLMAFNFVGDGLRDALDPRMRR